MFTACDLHSRTHMTNFLSGACANMTSSCIYLGELAILIRSAVFRLKAVSVSFIILATMTVMLRVVAGALADATAQYRWDFAILATEQLEKFSWRHGKHGLTYVQKCKSLRCTYTLAVASGKRRGAFIATRGHLRTTYLRHLRELRRRRPEIRAALARDSRLIPQHFPASVLLRMLRA